MNNTSILNLKKIVNLPLTDQKKEIDKIKPIVKNSDDIEGLKKREKKINSVIKNFNFDELDEEEK